MLRHPAPPPRLRSHFARGSRYCTRDDAADASVWEGPPSLGMLLSCHPLILPAGDLPSATSCLAEALGDWASGDFQSGMNVQLVLNDYVSLLLEQGAAQGDSKQQVVWAAVPYASSCFVRPTNSQRN